MNSKKYYLVFMSPVQIGAMYHTGEHPLMPQTLKQLLVKVVTVVNLRNGVNFPPDAVTITWVTELPEGFEMPSKADEIMM
jgi:hypothetical protein